MSATEDKKTLSENTDPMQTVNPAMLVKAPKLPIKVEFFKIARRKSITITKSKRKGADVK